MRPCRSPAGVHPRASGEQALTEALVEAIGGPFPREQGVASELLHGGLVDGSIPAGAGSSPGRPGTRPGSRVHPHGRGEHCVVPIAGGWVAGPSPRVRGAEPVSAGPEVPQGAIPASAGSRRARSGRRSRRRVHPCGRGEQSGVTVIRPGAWGPSPRGRGAADAFGDGLGVAGIIPAGAGSSTAARTSSPPPWVHPCGCGGADPEGEGLPAARGSIPTGTGSRGTRRGCPGCGRVHPRGRGEQRPFDAHSRARAGPSPRERGAGRRGVAVAYPPGPMPARAGSRCGRGRTSRRPWVYPRASGERAGSARAMVREGLALSTRTGSGTASVKRSRLVISGCFECLEDLSHFLAPPIGVGSVHPAGCHL